MALAVSTLLAITAFIVAFLYIPNIGVTAIHPSTNEHLSPFRNRQNKVNQFILNMRGIFPSLLSSLILLLATSFCVLFAWAFIGPPFMFYAYNNLGWNSSMLGLMMSTYGIALTLGELGFGQLSDRLGRKPVIIVGLLLFSAQFVGLAFFSNNILIAIAFMVAGLGNALYDPAISASILDISPEQHRVQILGIKSMIGSMGSIFGPALVALFNSFMNAHTIFLTSVIVILLIACINLCDLINKKHSVNPRSQSVIPLSKF
jgi:MFS family permease